MPLGDQHKDHSLLFGRGSVLFRRCSITRYFAADRRDSHRWYNNFAPPHRITPLKGNVHVAVCRGFIDYVLHSPVAADILRWVRYTEVPDETYFATLNHNPHLGVPGAYLGRRGFVISVQLSSEMLLGCFQSCCDVRVKGSFLYKVSGLWRGG